MEVINKVELSRIAAGLYLDVDLKTGTYNCNVTRDDMEYLQNNIPEEQLAKANKIEKKFLEIFDEAFSDNTKESLTISGNEIIFRSQNFDKLVLVVNEVS